jgi:hypothetical protein
LGPEKEPSSSARSSLWRLGLLGILVSSFTIIGQFLLKSRQPGAESCEAISPKNRSEEHKGGIPPSTSGGEGIIAEDPNRPERAANRNGSPRWRRWISWIPWEKVGITSAVAYAIVTYCMYKQMIRSNELTREAFEIGQRSYMVLGRKDGVVAEFKQTSDPEGWPSATLYLQNAGRLPASTVCVQTTISAWPIDPNQHGDGGC